MKLIILLLFSSNLLGQTAIETKFSSEICNCLSGHKELKEFDSKTYSDCFFKVARSNYSLLQKECIRLYGDTSAKSGKLLGTYLERNLSVTMIQDCEAYFKLKKAQRYFALQALTNLNNDSLKLILGNLNHLSEDMHNNDFFYKRGVVYFQLQDFQNAVADFHMAFVLDSSDYSSLAKEAWTREILGEYDEAIRIYDTLAFKKDNHGFLIFSAMIRREKTGQ
jgi:tetratricopeptide (TPR) repeat protein